jgi:hypothetical protein
MRGEVPDAEDAKVAQKTQKNTERDTKRQKSAFYEK